jgi:hypothetical protein
MSAGAGNKSDESREPLGQLSLDIPLAIRASYKLASRGHYDAQTLKKNDPEKYQLIVEYLAKGVFSKREIAEVLDSCFETVVAIEMERRVDIRAGKRGMASAIALILATNEERLLEKARTEGLSALEHAILIDKHELLTGGVTERIGHVLEEDPDVAEYKQFLAAKDVSPMVLGDGPALPALGMGSGVGKISQEGGGLGAAAGQAARGAGDDRPGTGRGQRISC